MANFGKRKAPVATGGSSSGRDADKWSAWKKHQHEQMPQRKETNPKGNKLRKQKVLIGKVNYIQSLGFPPPPARKWSVKPEWVAPTDAEGNPTFEDGIYSDYEVNFMKANDGSDFIWEDEWDKDAGERVKVRKQTSVVKFPEEEWGICVDFPQWLINFALHPNAPEGAEDDWRPQRISLNGDFMGNIQHNITYGLNYKSGEVPDNNRVRAIAIACGLDKEFCEAAKKEFKDRDGTVAIATLAEGVCNFKVTSDWTENDDKEDFYSKVAASPSTVEDLEDEDGEVLTPAEKRMEKIANNESLAPFTGILLDMDMEDLTDDVLKMAYSTGNAYHFNARAEQSEEVLIEGVSNKTKKEYSFTKGVDYDTTNFAKALEKWKKKQDKGGDSGSSKVSGKGSSDEDKQTPKEDGKPAGKAPKVNASKPEPVKSEPIVLDDEDDMIPF